MKKRLIALTCTLLMALILPIMQFNVSAAENEAADGFAAPESACIDTCCSASGEKVSVFYYKFDIFNVNGVVFPLSSSYDCCLNPNLKDYKNFYETQIVQGGTIMCTMQIRVYCHNCKFHVTETGYNYGTMHSMLCALPQWPSNLPW